MLIKSHMPKCVGIQLSRGTIFSALSKSPIFWGVTPLERHQRFGGTSYLRRFSWKMKAENSSKTLVSVYQIIRRYIAEQRTEQKNLRARWSKKPGEFDSFELPFFFIPSWLFSDDDSVETLLNGSCFCKTECLQVKHLFRGQHFRKWKS